MPGLIKNKVPHVSLREYVSLKSRKEIDFNLRYGEFEPLDLYNLGNLIDCKFGAVKDAQELLNYQGLTWEKYIKFIVDNKGVKEIDIYSESLYRVQQSRIYLREQVEEINKLESMSLAQPPTEEEEAAGIDIFEKYRSFIPIDKLMTAWNYTREQVLDLPYLIAFMKLNYEKDKVTFNEALTIIRNRKTS